MLLVLLLIVLLSMSVLVQAGDLVVGSNESKIVGIAWNDGNMVRMAIANSSNSKRMFTVGTGNYYDDEAVVQYFSGVTVPARSVVVKNLILPENVFTAKNIKLSTEYIFIKEFTEILSSIKVQNITGDLNYGFTDFLIESGTTGYLYLLGSSSFKNGIETYFNVGNKYTLKDSNKTEELVFLGINNLGLDYINDSSNNESTLIKVLPRGALFEFKVEESIDASIGVINIKKIVKNGDSISEGYITPPEFLIIGKDMEIIEQ